MELSEPIRKFILPTVDQENFTHRTRTKEIADNIIKKGFRFTHSFFKTTDEIIDDLVYLKYWDTIRKHYGAYIVIISFSRKMLNQLESQLNSSIERQQVLSKIDVAQIKGDEDIFTLPSEYVKGYIKREDGDITFNPNFNPDYIAPNLESNLKYLNS